MRKYVLAVSITLLVAFSAVILSACSSAAPTATLVPSPTVAAPTPTATNVLPTATPESAGQPVYGGVLRYPLTLPTSGATLDGEFMVNAWQYWAASYAIYDNLISLGSEPDNTILPDLATSWDFSTDGKTITFHLRQGVKFSDGEDFNAQVVKFDFDRVMDPNSGSGYGSIFKDVVSSVTVIDPYTVQVTLKTPYRPFMVDLWTSGGHMEPPGAITSLGKDFGQKPVGTGPFVLKDFVVGDHVYLTKNNNYWQSGKPYLDEIQIVNASDSNTQLAMVRTGEAELASTVPATEVSLVQNNPNLVVYSGYAAVEGVTANMVTPPFNNLALRQAMAYSFDRPDLIKSIYGGAADPAYWPTIPTSWAYPSGSTPMYQYDLTKAKAQLSAAGYSSSTPLQLSCDSGTYYTQMCEVFQSDLQQAGMNVQIRTVPASDYWAAMHPQYPGGQNLFAWYYWTERADPQLALQYYYASDGIWNPAGLNDPQLDQLITQAGTIYDVAKAKVVYAQLQQRAMETDLSFIPLVYPKRFWVLSNKVGGFAQHIGENPLNVEFYWLKK